MSRPKCLACGKGLPKYEAVTQQRGQAPRASLWLTLKVWPNSNIDHSTPRDKWPSMTGDGQPPTRGKCGDNVFCSTNCGWAFAVRAVIAAGGPQEASRMMPEVWQVEKLATQASDKKRKSSKARRDARKKRQCMMPVAGARGRCARGSGHDGDCATKAQIKARFDEQTAGYPID